MIGRRSIPASVVLSGLVAGAIAARAGVRLAGGEEAFLNDGYTFYLDIANGWLAGNGLCYAPDTGCAMRMPVYPVLLASLLTWGGLFPSLILVQAIVGGAIAALAWWIGRELFDARTGLLAALAVAVNPYAVVHDTAMQETVVFNALVAASIALLLRSRTGANSLVPLAAGVALGLAVLTSARIALLVPFVLVWALAGSGPGKARLRRAVLIGAPVLLLTGGWMWRNHVRVGAPLLTTEGGEALYFGNSPLTFLHYPDRSIDLVADEIVRLPAGTYDMLARLQGHDVALDAAYRSLALAYITSAPGEAAAGAARKLWIAASGRLSPARGAALQAAYQALFATVHVLALIGAWRARRSRGRGHALIAMVFLSFALTTAVFWAHTSHKSYLDPFLFIYAAWAAAMVKRG